MNAIRSSNDYKIRPIEPGDNAQMADLIVSVLASFGCVGEGYACADWETQHMYDAYRDPKSAYWVVEEKATGRVVGGCGYARLKKTTEEESICELQKLYFYEEVRGLGLARRLMDLVLEAAMKDGYREMYLETIPPMEAAQKLYKKTGFDYIETHRGDTGHHERCKVYMLRALDAAPALAKALSPS